MNENKDDAIHMKLEMQQQQNAEAIGALTKTVNALAKSINTESKSNTNIVHELKEASKECSIRFEHMMNRMEDKKEQIDNIHKALSYKAEKAVVDKALNRLWAIGGGVVMILVGALGFMIKLKMGGH